MIDAVKEKAATVGLLLFPKVRNQLLLPEPRRRTKDGYRSVVLSYPSNSSQCVRHELNLLLSQLSY